jgi:two-component system sensor histidine kinase KdpD
VWTFPPDATVPQAVVWSGELEAPLAGRWRWVSKYGDAWWNTPRVRRWAGPVLLFLAAFLVLPIALLVSMRRRRRQEEARVRFLNELAHDLRTPLTSLRLHAELLARGTKDPAKRARYEATVTREAARLSGLLANVLDLSRLERGKRSLETVTLSVASAVGQAVSEFVATHPDRKDDVQLEGPDDTQVVADPSALGRVLANLLDNAGKFTEPGTAIALRWDDAGARTRIVIADEGPGIPVGEEQRVFDRYVRGQSSGQVPGTGLGLSLVRELVQEMDGTVVLLPSSKGAVFEIRLPEPKDD